MQRSKTVKRVKTIINSVGVVPPPPAPTGPNPIPAPASGPNPVPAVTGPNPVPATGPLDFLQNMEKGFDAFFNTENKNTLHRPWLKLDRALKADRLRIYANDYPGLSDDEKQRLIQMLLLSLERGALKTRQTIIYNSDTCKIEDIKGLIVLHSDNGRTFKIDPPRATKRRSRTQEEEK
jgi:hypothetical protein